MNELSERIYKLRDSLTLTQEEFAKKINLKRNTISLIERGKRNPSERTIHDMSVQFNVNETWLLTGEGPMWKVKHPLNRYMEAFSSLEKEHDYLALEILCQYYLLDNDSKKIVKNFIKDIAAHAIKDE